MFDFAVYGRFASILGRDLFSGRRGERARFARKHRDEKKNDGESESVTKHEMCLYLPDTEGEGVGSGSD